MTLTKSEKDQIKGIEDRLTSIESQLAKVKNIVVGIAIGVGIGAAIFGYLTLKEVISFAK